MRRVLVVLLTLVVVNLPFFHQTLTDRKISQTGRDAEATLVEARTLNGRHFVDYRLPRGIDPDRTQYSARVDDETYSRAQESRVLAVRVVPGEPHLNRVEGEVGSRLFAVVALTSDALALLAGVLLWRRWRRWARYEVVAVGDGLVGLAARGSTLTASAPPDWVARLVPGAQVSGSMHLLADADLLPGLEHGLPPGVQRNGLEQVGGSAYVVRGRVLDARAGRVQLELPDGFRLLVETGPHRVRADIRDSTEVSGTLCFTPTIARA